MTTLSGIVKMSEIKQQMRTTADMTWSEQMELGQETMQLWPTPCDQLTLNEQQELAVSTLVYWDSKNPKEMSLFWADLLDSAYENPRTKSWADQMDDGEEIDWNM